MYDWEPYPEAEKPGRWVTIWSWVELGAEVVGTIIVCLGFAGTVLGLLGLAFGIIR